MNQNVRKSCLLVLTALIWGIAFVAQTTGGDTVGAFSFNCIRSLIGGIVLIPVIHVLDTKTDKKPKTAAEKKTLLTGGIACGCVMFIASSFQQLGISLGTEAGKAGFLTACYILLVPILGLFLKKKCGWNIWIGVVLTLAGLYLLCMNGTTGFSLRFSDGLVIICAVCFSLHILLVDHFSPLVDGVRLSSIQFIISGLIGLIPTFFVDMHHSLSGFYAWLPALQSWNAWIPILYAGVMSCGVGYTLQIIGQNGLNPTIASLLMSLESVFSVLAGWIIIGQKLTPREILGCVIIFVAIVLAQIPVNAKTEE
ncbi:MAG: DMT family transporter [Lachnospiraceae bacterium]